MRPVGLAVTLTVAVVACGGESRGLAEELRTVETVLSADMPAAERDRLIGSMCSDLNPDTGQAPKWLKVTLVDLDGGSRRAQRTYDCEEVRRGTVEPAR